MKAKSTIVESAPAEEKIEYPCLMQHSCGEVVLFTSEGVGVLLVAAPGGRYQFGHGSDMWVKSTFTPFRGKITLENV